MWIMTACAAPMLVMNLWIGFVSTFVDHWPMVYISVWSYTLKIFPIWCMWNRDRS